MNDSFPHRCPYCGTYKIGLRALGIHMDYCATNITKPMAE